MRVYGTTNRNTHNNRLADMQQQMAQLGKKKKKEFWLLYGLP